MSSIIDVFATIFLIPSSFSEAFYLIKKFPVTSRGIVEFKNNLRAFIQLNCQFLELCFIHFLKSSI